MSPLSFMHIGKVYLSSYGLSAKKKTVPYAFQDPKNHELLCVRETTLSGMPTSNEKGGVKGRSLALNTHQKAGVR